MRTHQLQAASRPERQELMGECALLMGRPQDATALLQTLTASSCALAPEVIFAHLER